MAFWWFWGLATLGLPAFNVGLAFLGALHADQGTIVVVAALEALLLYPFAAREYEDRPTALRVWMAGVTVAIVLTILFGFLAIFFALRSTRDFS